MEACYGPTLLVFLGILGFLKFAIESSWTVMMTNTIYAKVRWICIQLHRYQILSDPTPLTTANNLLIFEGALETFDASAPKQFQGFWPCGGAMTDGAREFVGTGTSASIGIAKAGLLWSLRSVLHMR